jgi:hypothetical protein
VGTLGRRRKEDRLIGKRIAETMFHFLWSSAGEVTKSEVLMWNPEFGCSVKISSS